MISMSDSISGVSGIIWFPKPRIVPGGAASRMVLGRAASTKIIEVIDVEVRNDQLVMFLNRDIFLGFCRLCGLSLGSVL